MRIHRGVNVDKTTDANIIMQISAIIESIPLAKQAAAKELIIQEILLRVKLPQEPI